MALSSATIGKFFRENFNGADPLQVAPEQREALGERIKQRLAGLDYVRIEPYPYLREEEKQRFVCAFSIEDPATYYYSSHNTFHLKLDSQNRLTIGDREHRAPVSDLAEIFAFIKACQERVQRRQAQKSKRQKVRNLKTQAVIARMKQLAKEEKFDFYTTSSARLLKLYVKLSDKECIELHVPFTIFEEVLPHLRETILSLRALYKRGIKFKVRSLSSYRWSRGDWIRHESL